MKALYAAGIRRVEATSFVSQTAVPQLADAADILVATEQMPELDSQVLVPTLRQAERAIAAGARHLAFVLSVSEQHNASNVKRRIAASIQEYASIIKMLPTNGKMRINIATAFDCPYEGRLPEEQTLRVLRELIDLAPPREIALCDTTGRVTPDHVGALFGRALAEFPEIQNWAFHAHDTYGLGTANTLAAWNSGVKIFDASFAGLGGCPFAPGATGNVATEDLVWMFEGMGVSTGIDIRALVAVAHEVAALPGAQTGGRVREALSGSKVA